ncbi:hypothetical protein JW752_03565 [Candidatus Peregrinibacteria bacterium]|nr:hypothetical protein [Candidatus Peregrinibacteria bacterium]
MGQRSVEWREKRVSKDRCGNREHRMKTNGGDEMRNKGSPSTTHGAKKQAETLAKKKKPATKKSL